MLTTTSRPCLVQLSQLAPAQLLPCPKEALPDNKISTVVFSLCNVIKSSKEAVADPVRVQSIRNKNDMF